MITADVRRAVWAAAGQAAADGELPPPGPAGGTADGRRGAGTEPDDASRPHPGPGTGERSASVQPDDASTLRPVPPALGGGPGRYASTLPYLLAAPGTTPHQVAAILAARLTALDWVAEAGAAAATGHLTITVTSEALTALAVRIPQARDSARSDILHGLRAPARPAADLAGAAEWPQAHAMLTAEVTARLAETAGAEMCAERPPPAPAPAAATASPVAAALAVAGSDAVRYALVSRPHGWRDGEGADVPVRYHLDNPVYAVRYAHAHAASTLRQAADLGLGAGPAAQFAPCLLTHPAERALLDALSWLPERVAWAARIRRPAEFARYLEELAGVYQDCRENRPALPYGGRRAPRDRPATRARLWLVTAAGTAIAAGLGLLGISAPDRL